MSDEAREYASRGYCVVRGLVPERDIDALLAEYRRAVVPSRERFFRHCRDNRWERNEIDSYGHVRQSFLDVHDFVVPALQTFSTRVRDILCGRAVADAVSALTGSDDNVLVLSMFFDANVGTPPHQDGWGIDSRPPGRLVGGWFALEDIDERAGRFYVLRNTHGRAFDVDEHRSDRAHEVFRRYVLEHREDVDTPALRKGDAIFWSPTVVHGSHATTDARFSRKSLTAHYMPAECKLGSTFRELRVQPELARHGDVRFTRRRVRYQPLLAAASLLGEHARARFPRMWAGAEPLRDALFRLLSR